MLVSIIVVLYTLLLFLLLIYAFHSYLMLYHFIKDHRKIKNPKTSITNKTADKLPVVTFQLPIYNEKFVVRRLIESCCAIKYPRDKFEIQILDDSDDETVLIVANLVRKYQGLGINIHHIRRGSRAGFKAGALQYGLESARGEFIAIFDADFVIPEDFLLRLIDEFDNPRVASVQARWGHLNSTYSFFTMAQAISLDGHFVVEQNIRSQAKYFINFNGTCGIWRKAAIIDAGGWQADTLAEDLDLSYRAQIKNWQIVFRPDVAVEGEIPVDADSYRTQQNRWAKGTIQVARKLLPRILKADLPLLVKYEATVHLTCHLIYPALLTVALLTLPIIFFKIELIVPPSYYLFASFFGLGIFGYPILYCLSQKELYKNWPKNITRIPFIIALCTGISLSNTKAVFEGFSRKKFVFTRTPKFGIDLKDKRNFNKNSYSFNTSFIPYVEIICGLYLFFSFLYVLVNEQLILAPFLFLYAYGFLYLGFSSTREIELIQNESLEVWSQKNY